MKLTVLYKHPQHGDPDGCGILDCIDWEAPIDQLKTLIDRCMIDIRVVQK